MSLDTVVEDIREEARASADEIREEAEAEAEEIIAEAETDAEGIITDAEANAEEAIERERDQALSSATLEAKQERLEGRREMLQSVREDVRMAVADVSGERREELTDALLSAAIRAFDGEDAGDVAVFGRADDRKLIEDLLSDREGFSWAGECDCLGGVVVGGESTRLRIDNTFDSVLDDVWEDELTTISERLFDE
jgi:V/A-type H+-transporting ATPase subunit E